MNQISRADREVWPGRARCGLSLSFDDGLIGQLDNAVPALDRRGLRATFYPHTLTLEPPLAEDPRRLGRRWTQVRASGHEIGNHTRVHPCSANFPWVVETSRPLEDFSLAEMEEEIDRSQRELEAAVGRRPATFAYPCGMSYVGRGEGRRSYVPLVARKFVVGRGFNSLGAASPLRCDLACVPALALDNRDLATLTALVETAIAEGHWLILAGHDVSDHPAALTTNRPTFEALLDWLNARRELVWVDTIEAIGSHLAMKRRQPDQ